MRRQAQIQSFDVGQVKRQQASIGDFQHHSNSNVCIQRLLESFLKIESIE